MLSNERVELLLIVAAVLAIARTPHPLALHFQHPARLPSTYR